jgi:predicted TIM-barrel fold metal-dependent hydrolase
LRRQKVQDDAVGIVQGIVERQGTVNVTRRALLAGAAGALMRAPSRAASAVAFSVPPGACDCHTHVFGDPATFPFWPGRTYTPEPASVAQLQALHKSLGLDRVVIVHPSVYGTDNRCTLDALARLGARARGIAVIDDATSDAQLDAMHSAGIRGVRVNLETFGQVDPLAGQQRFRRAVQRLARRPWHVQLYARSSVVEALETDVMACPIPVVFDHFGGAQAAAGVDQAGFRSLVRMVGAGKAYVKVSAAYRISSREDFTDVIPLARALIAANPQRILWGSDWPHPSGAPRPGRTATDIAPSLAVDDVGLFNQLAVWAPDAALRNTILVENPARLFGF